MLPTVSSRDSTMAQIIDPLPSDDSEPLLCCYVNATSKIQIARVTNIPDWYFERVVFPGQRLMFEAVPSAMLEIHTGMMASAILSDTIPCKRLGVESNHATGAVAAAGFPSSGALNATLNAAPDANSDSDRADAGTLTGAIAE